MKFSEILKNLRKENNISQLTLSKNIDFSQSVISDWENNISEPNIIALNEIANYFKVTTDYLLGRADDFNNVQIENELTSREKQILNVFRQSGELGQEVIFAYASGVLNQYKQSKKIY